METYFSESLCVKNIRSEVKLLLTDISHGKYTVSCTIILEVLWSKSL